jgi:hypothetical protein
MMGSVVRDVVDKCRSCPYVKILRDLETRDVRQGSCVGNGFSDAEVRGSMRLHSQLRKR